MTVTWSDSAKECYMIIIEQLFEKWNISIVESFENDTISLIYRIQDNTLEIVTFLFNQSEHFY